MTPARGGIFGRNLTTALALLALSSCGVTGLDFVEDKRVAITSPTERAKVKFPVTITWTVRDFEITGADGQGRADAGYFGVYVDRSPQPPEKSQDWLVRDDVRVDPACRRNPDCPDQDFLERKDIHSTTETSFTIESLPPPPSNITQKRREFHEVTIALLNGRGERIGEGAFTVMFEVDRET